MGPDLIVHAVAAAVQPCFYSHYLMSLRLCACGGPKKQPMLPS